MKSQLLLMVLLLGLRTWSTEESLGDAARREQERRKKNKEDGVAVQVVEDGEVRRSLMPDPPSRRGGGSCGGFDYDGMATSYDGCGNGGCATYDAD